MLHIYEYLEKARAGTHNTELATLVKSLPVELDKITLFARLYQIEGADSTLSIKGFARYYQPFPQSDEPLAKRFWAWVQSNTAALLPLFESKGPESIYMQTLIGLLEARAEHMRKAGKEFNDIVKDQEEFKAAFEGNSDSGKFKVGALKSILNNLFTCYAPLQFGLPSPQVLTLLLDEVSNLTLAPEKRGLVGEHGLHLKGFDTVSEDLAAIAGNAEYLAKQSEGLVGRLAGSEYLGVLIKLEDATKFNEMGDSEFSTLDALGQVKKVISYCATNNNTWTDAQVVALSDYIVSKAERNPDFLGEVVTYLQSSKAALELKSFAEVRSQLIGVMNSLNAATSLVDGHDESNASAKELVQAIADSEPVMHELVRSFLVAYPELDKLFPDGVENKFAATMPEVVAPARPASPASVFSMGEGARMSPAATDATADDRSTPGLDESDSDSRAGARPISMGTGSPSATKVVGVKLPLEQLADFSAKTGGVTTSDLGAIKEFATSLKDSLALNDGNYQKLVQALKKDEHAGLMPVLDSIREILANNKSLSAMMVIDTLRARVEDASYDATIKPKEGAKSTGGTFKTDMLFMRFEADSGAPVPEVLAVK